MPVLIEAFLPHGLRLLRHQPLQHRLIVGGVFPLQALQRPCGFQLLDEILHGLQRPGVRQQLLSQLFQQRFAIHLIKNREVGKEVRVALGFRLDEVIAKAMQRAHNNPATRLACQLLDTLAHFAAGLVRKGQAENLLRLRTARLQDGSDAASQRIRLARPRRGQQQEITLQFPDDRALLQIESLHGLLP